MDCLDGLNDEQVAYVTHEPGQASILLAGAGSGKTKSIQARVEWLIAAKGVNPRKICVVTFTNKAAREIGTRVQEAMPHIDPANMPRLTTIHSLSLSMVRRNPPAFGLQRATPMSDYDQKQMLKGIVTREKLTDVDPYEILKHIEYHRARGLGFPAEYTDAVHAEALLAYEGAHALTPNMVKVWKLFAEEKEKSHLIDFSDMIHLSVRRGRNDPKWLAAVGQIFEHVLVDEVQDTNTIQFEFVNMLVGQHNRSLSLVGDASQSIYGFSGASPKLLTDYIEDWRGSKPTLFKLVRNHRSCQSIVTFANRTQAKMVDMPLMKMESFRGMQGEKGEVSIVPGRNPYEIASAVASEIRRDGVYKKFAILLRAGIQLREIEGELIKARIPYIVRGGNGLLQTEEVRDILAYLRFAINPNDFQAMTRAMGVPKRGIGEKKWELIRERASKQYRGDLLQSSKAMGTGPGGESLGSFANTIEHITKYMADPAKALEVAIAYSGYIGFIKKKYVDAPKRIETKLENLDRLKDMVKGIMEESDLTVEDMIFQMTMETPEKETPEGRVTISTIHSSKGLEWDTCIVWNMNETQLPNWRCTLPEEIMEERRVWYVAQTRARNRLIIAVPSEVTKGESLRKVDPSRFLYETRALVQ